MIPEWISNDEECDIDLVGILQNDIGLRLDHFAICHDNIAAVERLLLLPDQSWIFARDADWGS